MVAYEGDVSLGRELAATNSGGATALASWPEVWNVVAPPDGFGWTPPFTVYESGGVYRSSLDLTALAPSGTAYYVDVDTGNDANPGTEAQPLKGIDTAMAKADCVVAYVKPGHYYRDQSMTTWPARNFSLHRWPGESGRIICSWAQTGLTFVNDPTYTNTWTTTRSNVLRVLDCANTDADGDYVQLTHVADAATCNTTQNSWATSGSTVYVNRTDDAEPTFNNTWLLVAVASNTSMTGNYTWYMEYCDLVGMAALVTSNAAGQTPMFYAYDCSFKFAGGWDGLGGDGISIDGSYAYMQDCVAAKCGNDGFNYDTANTNLPYGLEIDTKAYGNGVYSNKVTAQGSSAHTGHVVRLNCEYYENNQENAWDTEGLSWNLGCNFHDPGGAAGVGRDSNYTSSSTMWLDGCISSGATYDLSCGAGDTIYYHDLTSGGSNQAGGTYTEYTPATSIYAEGRALGVAGSGAATALASASAGRSMAATDSGMASALGSAALGRTHAATDSGMASALGSVSAGRELGATDAATAAALSSATLGRTHTATATGGATALASATLGRAHTAMATALRTLAAAVTVTIARALAATAIAPGAPPAWRTFTPGAENRTFTPEEDRE